MILSRSIAFPRNIFLTSLKNRRIQSRNIHVLCVRPRLHAGASTVFSAEINQIITRLESSQAHTSSEDIFLNTSEESKVFTEASSSTTTISNDDIPDIPVLESTTSDVPDLVTDIVVPLNKLGEPTLQSIDLGCYWTPVGLVQNLLDFVHCTFNLPWWASISVCIVMARLLLFPIVIKSQRNSIKFNNAMPEMQSIQTRMQKAKRFGNDAEAMQAAFELSAFMKEKNLKIGRTFALPLMQAPIFISFFMGLRAMANVPVESFKNGGLWWFQDLTCPDPYFILPAATCVTLYLAIQAGVDIQKMPSTSDFARIMPKVFKIIPVVVFPFIMNFPSAVCVYWATTNVVSLAQVLFLRIPKVRQYFNIEVKQNHPPPDTGLKKEGFVKGVKSAWGNMKIAKEIEERDRLDEANFKRAGKAPPAKTFRRNPLLKEEPFVQAKKN